MEETQQLPEEKRKVKFPSRDTLLLVSGILLTANEAIIRSGPERPYLMILFAGMMGLPVFLQSDEKKDSSKSKGEDS